jgi:hypothetical protein
MSGFYFLLSLLSIFGSTVLYSVYYARAEAIVCYRIHISQHPLRDYYHWARLFDKIGLVLFGSSLTLSIIFLIRILNSVPFIFSLLIVFDYLVFLVVCFAIGVVIFNSNFDNKGKELYDKDEAWKFSTGSDFLDDLFGFKW